MPELRLLLENKRDAVKVKGRQLIRRDVKIEGQKTTMATLLQKIRDADDKQGLLPLMRKAYEEGALENNSNMADIMKGMLQSMVDKQRRRYSVSEKSFYATLLSYGGPFLHDFVSKNLSGPALSTSRYPNIILRPSVTG